MRALDLQGVRRGKAVRTTVPGKDGRRAGDLLNRDFTAPAPNRTWVMDFTYVRTWQGFVYVAFVLDVFAHKIVAWNATTTKAVELVDVPVRIALWQRDRDGHPVVPGELIGHADAGSQYTSIAFTDHLAAEGIRPSIGTVADAYDCEHRDCATIWGLTLAYDRPCGCPRVDVSAPGGGVHQAAGRVGSDLIGA